MDNTNSHTESEIAIIGLSGRFPGARDVDRFWQNLRDGVETISFFSEEELLSAGVPASLLSRADYVRAGGLLDDIDMFDAQFFGFSQREAEITDPQQRLFLEHAWEALENAGYNPDSYKGRIGVYAGVGMNLYLFDNLCSQREIIRSMGSFQTVIQNDKDFAATRVSYKLNLKGPSVAVQSACSTSLLAVHLACQSLLNGECEMALAGGAALGLLRKTGYLYQEGGISSPDGHCRAFDAQAQGTVTGDGVGVVVMKRLADALDDRNSVVAVIKGSAANNDGSLKVGYTAPSVDGQANVIAEALAVAGVSPESIGYIEAHGTGTQIGDPIEIEGLTKCFRAATNQKAFCAIGSVKTNIGHLDAAAGIAGLIKTALALKYQLIPPSLHFNQPNREIDFENSPFYVNTEMRRWDGPSPRRAGVSSFGIGGTNVHVVLEEAPLVRPSADYRRFHLLTLSAKTRSALDKMTMSLAAYLKGRGHLNLNDVAYTLQAGRKRFTHRRTLVCSSIETAVEALESGGARPVKTREDEHANLPVVFMFPGQGAQYDGMGLDLYRSEPVFRDQLDLCSSLLEAELGLAVSDLLYASNGHTRQLNRTWITQPVMFAVDYAFARLWMEWGVQPAAMIGHSLGEYVAACLSGVLSLEDALQLVAIRGRLMEKLPEGAMLAVPLSEAEVRRILDGAISLAAVNGPSRCVVSGARPAISVLRQRLAHAGIDSRLLNTSHAFHSELMEAVLAPFAQHVKEIKLQSPRIPYVSNVTGKWITAEEVTSPNYWLEHLRLPVRFADGVTELLKDQARILLEVGPGRTLSGLARQQKEASGRSILSSLHRDRGDSEVAAILETVGELWLAGAEVDWDGFYAERPRRIALPTYPFERKRYWIDPAPAAKASANGIGALLEQQGRIISQQLYLLNRARSSRELNTVAGPAPLTPIQQWFFEQNLENPHHWNHSILLEVDRRCNPAHLGEAFAEMMGHHDAFRLRFFRQGAQVRQISAESDRTMLFSQIDLSRVPPTELASAIESKAAELQVSLNLSEGPIARAAFFDLGGQGTNRLLLVIHHLAVDIYSWRVLLEDLNTAYRQISRGRPIRLAAKTATFREWAQRLNSHAQSEEVRREANYWLSNTPASAARLPVDHDLGVNTAGSARTLSFSLTTQETSALLDRARTLHRAQASTVILSAVAAALARWRGERALLVDLEGHGREPIFDHVDLSRTVGWLTSMYPVLLEVREGSPEEGVDRVNRRIGQTPGGGIGYGLLRYLNQDSEIREAMRTLPRAQVCFNYWGAFDRVPERDCLFVPAKEPAGPHQDAKGIRSHLIDISGAIRNERLEMAWSYSQNIHSRSSIETVAADCIDVLRSLASRQASRTCFSLAER